LVFGFGYKPWFCYKIFKEEKSLRTLRTGSDHKLAINYRAGFKMWFEKVFKLFKKKPVLATVIEDKGNTFAFKFIAPDVDKLHILLMDYVFEFIKSPDELLKLDTFLDYPAVMRFEFKNDKYKINIRNLSGRVTIKITAQKKWDKGKVVDSTKKYFLIQNTAV
jgi:hypothetical protein